MDAGDQAADWRTRLKGMRTVRGLRAEPAQAGVTDRLSEAVLAAAPDNPDHSASGQAAARQALMARGVAPTPWRLRVPGFVKREHLEAKGERLFFGAGRTVRKAFGMLTWLAFVVLLVALFVVIPAKEEALRDAAAQGVVLTDVDTDEALLDSPEMAPVRAALGTDHAVLNRAMWGERVGLVASGVFGLSFFLWLVSSMLRRRPARVLLLRKFNVKAIGKTVSNMILTELRPYGHICSLSDKHIRRSRFGWITHAILAPANPVAAVWVVLMTPIRLVYRLFDRSRMGPALVTNARDYRNLARRLRDRIGLNTQIVTTQKEAFLVRTSDEWWKLVIRLLMDSADVIVVDLSQVTEGTAWELDVIRAENVVQRCVFVALWGKEEEANAALTRWGFANPCHFYAPDGAMVKRTRFRAAMLDAMRATHGLTA